LILRVNFNGFLPLLKSLERNCPQFKFTADLKFYRTQEYRIMKIHKASRIIVALLVLQSLFYFSIVPAMAEQSAASEPKQTVELNNSIIGLGSGFLSGLLNFFNSPSPNSVSANEQNPLWTETNKEALQTDEIQARGQSFPTEYRVLRLNENALRGLLAAAPHENAISAKDSPSEINLPLPEGGYGRFRIVEAPILSDESAAQFPDFRSYLGQGIDDPTATLRFSVTPRGFHAQVLAADRSFNIERVAPELGGDLYINYDLSKQTHGDAEPFACEVVNDSKKKTPFDEFVVDRKFDEPGRSGGAIRYSFRFAVAATGEYTAFYRQTGDTDAQAQQRAFQVIFNTVGRINGLLERELSVRLVLVTNTNVIYTDGTTDPYTDSNTNAMLAENQTNLDSVIGNNAYDLGHVFAFGGGGVAQFNAPCNSATKGQGVSGRAFLNNTDPFRDTLYAHEIGHQFGANHTFNAATGACGNAGQRTAATAFEVGSGSTIMGYPGTCSPSNLQGDRDSYYHVASLNQMDAFIKASSGGSSCAAQTNIGNSIPVVNAGSDFQIPRNTPFTLTGAATDADNDALTYIWEQYDNGTTQATMPLFRSRLPSTNLSRSFPDTQYTLSGGNIPPATIACANLPVGSPPQNNCIAGETLPTVDRTMKFRFTARDNRAAGGASDDDEIQITVSGAPFSVTSPNTSSVSWNEGSQQTVTWDVGGGSVAADVKISLSTDGGQTFPFVLLNSTTNDGAAQIIVPDVGASGSTQARIKVEAVGNVFFDVSDQNFTIVESPVYTVSGRITMPGGGLENITVQLDRGGLEPRTTRTDANGDYIFNFVPANANYTITPSSQQHVFGPAIHTTGILTANVTRDFIARTGRTYTWTQLTQVIAIQEGNPQQIQRNNHWNNFYNWSPYGIPGADDRIIVNDTPRIYQPPGGLDPITYNPQGLSLNGVAYSINGFSLDGNSITGGILTLGGDIPGSSQMKHGLLDLVLNVNAGATFDWNGGTFHSAATVAQNGFFLVTGTGERTIGRDGVVINNAGEMLWSGSPTITMLPTCFSCGWYTFTINNTGTTKFQGTETFHAGDHTNIVFNNIGTTVKTSPSINGATKLTGTGGLSNFVNSGTLQVLSGVMDFGGGGRLTLKNNSTITGGAPVLVNGGELILPFEDNGTSVLDGYLEFRNGRVDGKGTINGSGIFNWTGGQFGIVYGSYTIAEDVQVAFGANITTNISGDADKRLGAGESTCNNCPRQSGRLTFNGTTNWTGAGKIFSSHSGASGITNNGTFNVRNDSQIYGGNFNFTNNGTVKKEIGTGTTQFGDGLNFNNGGTIDNTSGTIEFTANLNLNAGSLLKGAGTIKSKGATRIYAPLTLGDSSSAGRFEFVDGALVGQYLNETPVSVINAGNAASRFVWLAGELHGDLKLGSSLTTEISGSANKDIGRNWWHHGSPSGALTNAGTINIEGGDIRFGFHYSTLVNNGTINIAGDVNFLGNYYTPFVTNTGTINKAAPLGAAIFDGAVNFINSGTLNAQTGLIEFNKDLYLDTGTIIKGDGVVRAKGFTQPRGTAVIGDAGGGGKFELAGGTLQGHFLNDVPNSFINSGNAASEFRWTGGRIFYTINLGAGLTTNITGAGNRDLGSWDWYHGAPWGALVNAGTINWHPGSDIRFAFHSATITNSGTLNLHGNGTIHGNYYGGSVTNTGTIEKINTDGATTIAGNLGFNNSGTIKLSLGAATNTNRLNVGGATPRRNL
jgi:hypothetical protein